MQLNKYFDTNIEKFDLDFLQIYSMYDRFLGKFGSDAKILEIGPGNGGFGYYLQKKWNLKPKNVHMIDISESVVNNLRQHAFTKGYTIIHEDVVKFLQKNGEKYDLIIMRHVLEHFEKKDINPLIPLLEKSLDSDGKIFVEVPNLANNSIGQYMAF